MITSGIPGSTNPRWQYQQSRIIQTHSSRKYAKPPIKLRKNIDAAEYKHIVLGLIFLKYISDAFDVLHDKLLTGEGDYAGADPEDRDDYSAENVFFVPVEARWAYLQAQAK